MNNYNWNEIKNQADIDDFMNMFDYFHDSCLKELRYESGAYVDKNLYMSPINSKRNIYVIFQRQDKNPSAIEMLFENIECMHLRPVNDSYTSEISEAFIRAENGLIVWFDENTFKNSYLELYENNNTWIKAHKVFWREINECMGESPIYANIK